MEVLHFLLWCQIAAGFLRSLAGKKALIKIPYAPAANEQKKQRHLSWYLAGGSGLGRGKSARLPEAFVKIISGN
jgi:hypothetical protein